MIYTISKRMEIAAAHKLDLSYESKCQNLHGHNWIVVVHCASTKLNKDSMVIDFKHVKNAIHDELDHKYINDVIKVNPTAENIAKWIMVKVNKSLEEDEYYAYCYKVEVMESEGNKAVVTDLGYFSELHRMELLACM